MFKKIAAVIITIFIINLLPLLIVFGFRGLNAFSLWQEEKQLQRIAEEHIRSTYGNHYYISFAKTNTTAGIFGEGLSGVNLTFADKNEKECSFSVYVKAYDKSISEPFYSYVENKALYQQYVNDHVQNYLHERGVQEEQYSFSMSKLEIENGSHDLWKYQSYAEMAADSQEMNRIKVTFILSLPDEEAPQWAYDLYRNLNQASCRYSRFDLCLAGQEPRTGIYRNGKCHNKLSHITMQTTE